VIPPATLEPTTRRRDVVKRQSVKLCGDPVHVVIRYIGHECETARYACEPDPMHPYNRDVSRLVLSQCGYGDSEQEAITSFLHNCHEAMTA
jgi:hypothetical protein